MFNSTAQELKIAMDEPEEPVEPDEPGQNEPEEPGRNKRSVVTQTTTFNGDKFDEKSFKIEVPPHQGNDELTVVMHAASNGYWHLSNLKVRSFWGGDVPLYNQICSGQHAVQERRSMSDRNNSKRLLPNRRGFRNERDRRCARRERLPCGALCPYRWGSNDRRIFEAAD